MNVNIKRARVIEFTDSGGQECLVKRDHASDLLFTGIQSSDSETKLGSYRLGNIQKYCTNIRVLDTFPVTLADLLPEGCTRFEFRDMNGTLHYARLMDPKREWPWHVSGLMVDREDFAKLDGIAEAFSVDLDTVIPLQVHSQYVEERR